MPCGCRGTNATPAGMALTRNRPTPRPSRNSRDIPETNTTSPEYFAANQWDGQTVKPLGAPKPEAT